jgi:hypothetical protein
MQQKRSKFNLSHKVLMTMTMGKLFPLTWIDVLPGDSIQMATSMLMRLTPLVAPVMHPVLVRIHNWYVPLRLIWDDFESFITGGEDGNDETEHPYISASSITEKSLFDMMGVPVGTYSPDLTFNAHPFRAYNMIWNHKYRDQDLHDELVIDTGNGEDTTTETDIQNVCWGKDYFTTSRPWTQRGDDITIPLGESAPITGLGVANQTYGAGPTSVYETDGSGTVSYDDYKSSDTSGSLRIEEDPDNPGYPNIRANLGEATGIDVRDLRIAKSLQAFRERMAGSGARYEDYLAQLGIRGLDARLQQPEFLGGGKQLISFSEVLSHDGANTGDMYGHGMAAMRSNRFRRYIPEHGIVMSLCSVVPQSIYSQGLSKKWSREVKEDYFQKEFQFIGEDEVYNKEVYAEHSEPEGIFGYQARYDEYRGENSDVRGEFLSTYDSWHLGRVFSSDPALNSTFVECNAPVRCFADQESDQLLVMCNHKIMARRHISRRAYVKIT